VAIMALGGLVLTQLSCLAFAGGPEGRDVTKPYFYRPVPEGLNDNDRLRLKTYRDQLYWQQQSLQLRQSTSRLTPDQQRRLNQTRQESDRINSLLGPSLSLRRPPPPVQTTIAPPPLIPVR
jgi:hypothetical protein